VKFRRASADDFAWPRLRAVVPSLPCRPMLRAAHP
jgi:hypothetical protein